MKRQIAVGVGIGVVVGLFLTYVMQQNVRSTELRRNVPSASSFVLSREPMVMVQHCEWCQVPISVSKSDAQRRVALTKKQSSETTLHWWEHPAEKDSEFASRLWHNGLDATSAHGTFNHHSASGPCVCGHIHSGPGFVPAAPVAGPAIRFAPAIQSVVPQAKNKPETMSL